MRNQVLSIEQMQELKSLGIDSSKASMFWHPAFYRNNGILDYDRYESIPRIKLENNYNLDYDILAFTLQDILEMLPNSIKFAQLYGILRIEKDSMNYYLVQYKDFVKEYNIQRFVGKSLLEAALNMLKWCKQNNYI